MTKEEFKDQYETWRMSPVTERLIAMLGAKKVAHITSMAHKSMTGSLEEIRGIGGRIQGLQDAEQIIERLADEG